MTSSAVSGWPSDHLRLGRSLNVYVSPSADVLGRSWASAPTRSPFFLLLSSPSNIRPISWLLAVSLLSIELNVRTSEKAPSTTCPPFLPVWVVVVLPPPQASRSSNAPPEKTVQAAVAPIRRRKSRRDQSSRNRSNCSKPLSSASSSRLISRPPADAGLPSRLPQAHRPSYWAARPMVKKKL